MLVEASPLLFTMLKLEFGVHKSWYNLCAKEESGNYINKKKKKKRKVIVNQRLIINQNRWKYKELIAEEQAGFVWGKGTREQIVNLRIIIEKLKECNVPLYNASSIMLSVWLRQSQLAMEHHDWDKASPSTWSPWWQSFMKINNRQWGHRLAIRNGSVLREESGKDVSCPLTCSPYTPSGLWETWRQSLRAVCK